METYVLPRGTQTSASTQQCDEQLVREVRVDCGARVEQVSGASVHKEPFGGAGNMEYSFLCSQWCGVVWCVQMVSSSLSRVSSVIGCFEAVILQDYLFSTAEEVMYRMCFCC